MADEMADLDWRSAPKADCAKAHERLSYLSMSVMDYDYLVRTVAAMVAAERETCAALCDAVASEYMDDGNPARDAAAQIRARAK